MENFFYVAIAIAYLVYYLIRAKNANQDAKKRPTPVAPRPEEQATRTISEQQSDRRNAESRQRQIEQQQNRNVQHRDTTTTPNREKSVFEILREELEGRNPRQQAPTPEPMERDPFLDQEASSQRYNSSRSSHLDDDHFSEERLIEDYKRQHAKGKQIVHHTHDYFNAETDGLKGITKISRKKTHPITKLTKGKTNIRNAVILKEVLDRKF